MTKHITTKTAAIALISMLVASTAIAAFNAAGALDATFGVAGKRTTDFANMNNDTGYGVARQADGKLVVAGTSIQNALDVPPLGDQYKVFAVARYLITGTLDPSFGIGGRVTTTIGAADAAYGVAMQEDQKIVVAGTSDGRFAVVRYNPNGSLDTSFDSDGAVTSDFTSGSYGVSGGRAVTIAANGDIVVVGYVNNGSENKDFALARYKQSDGALDSTFNNLGSLPPFIQGLVATSILCGSCSQEEDIAEAVAIQPSDGQLVVVGSTKSGQFMMTRYASDGTRDTGFGTAGNGFVQAGTPQVGPGYGVAIQSDDKIVATGAKYVIDNASTNCINSSGKYCQYRDVWVGRFDSTGAPDTGFGTNGDGEVTTPVNTRGNDDEGRALAIQPNQRIVVVGNTDASIHTYTNGGNDESFIRSNDFAVLRYLSTGALDTTFDGDGKVSTNFAATNDDVGYAVVLQPDGKIVVAGASESDFGRDFAVARYDGDAAATATPTAPPGSTATSTPTRTPTPPAGSTATPTATRTSNGSAKHVYLPALRK